jgi:hypothetical protein
VVDRCLAPRSPITTRHHPPLKPPSGAWHQFASSLRIHCDNVVFSLHDRVARKPARDVISLGWLVSQRGGCDSSGKLVVRSTPLARRRGGGSAARCN